MYFLPVYTRLLILTTYAFIPLTDFYFILSFSPRLFLVLRISQWIEQTEIPAFE